MTRLFALALLVAVAAAPVARADDTVSIDTGPIGTATMAADGTVTLWLRAELPNHGGVAHGTIAYRPDNRQYRDVLLHVGGLKPGETKLVKPWLDKN
jgi:hypothetical protein